MHITHQRKGNTVIDTEHRAKTPRSATGLFAVLCGPFGAQGTGASRIGQGGGAPARVRSLAVAALTTLCALIGGLAFAAAPALAAAPPEEPTTLSPATSITGTSAVFEGVLNPHSDALVGGYFAYSEPEGLTCLEGPGAGLEGFEGEQEVTAQDVHATVGLQPDRKYKFCLVAYNQEGSQLKPGNEVSVQTPAIAPTVESESISAVTPTSANLDAVVNANNEEVTKCEFQYGTSATLASSTTVGCEPATLAGVYGGQPVEHVGVSGLKPDTTYYYRVTATNATGVEKGAITSFQTTPERPETGKVKAGSITATTVEMEGGVLNPKTSGEGGEYQYVYRLSATECEGESSSLSVSASGALKEAVSPPVKLENLQPNATYAVCLIEHDAGGSSLASTAVTVKTLTAPATIESISASNIKSSEATLEGVVNPNNQLTECHFQYGKGTVSENTVACTPESLEAVFENVNVGPTKSEAFIEYNGQPGTRVVPAPITALSAATTYKYRIITKNGKGEESEKQATFTTNPLPETPETTAASEETGGSAKLNGVLNPGGHGEAGTYEFLYNKGGGCEGASKAPESPIASTGSTEPVSTTVSKLLPGTEYAYCLRATNSLGETSTGQTLTFVTTAIGQENSPTVTATEATLSAEIGTDGAETTYHVQYGTNSAEETATAETTIPAASAPVAVEVGLPGLKASTTYYFHFVANNGHGSVEGEERTFTTPAAPGSEPPQNCPNEQRRVEQPFAGELPDCRAYELVSPANTEGQDATAARVEDGPRASVCGEECEELGDPAVAYSSFGSFGGASGADVESELLSRRGSAGWTTQNITPPIQPITPSPGIGFYQAVAFTPELSAGLATTKAALAGSGAPPYAGAATYDLYLADFATGAYRYIEQEEHAGGGQPMGASTDLSHVVFGQGGEVSEWVDGSVTPVGVANDGTPISVSASVGGATNSPARNQSKDAWHAVSENGSRVYFTSPGFEEGNTGVGGDRQLYVRVNAEQPQPSGDEQCEIATDACTIEVSRSQKTNGSGPEGTDPLGEQQSARYWGASANGAKVFFTSNAELTEDAYTDEDKAANLYEYNLEDQKLTDLTVDAEAATQGAAVQGVAQISEDGSYLYFVAKGVLKGAAGEALKNARGEEPRENEDNLYVSHENRLAFVATLAAGDISDWDNGTEDRESEAGPEINTAVTSPGGERLAFVSERGLTGYDNRQAQPGQCQGLIGEGTGEDGTGNCREVFLYDAGSGRTACASCNPSGARPVGPSGGLKGGSGAFGDYRPRNLLADGTLFFNSSDALIAHASDGRQNVYEYEDGHVYPISDVADGYESFFMDASLNGEDVFFASADRLSPEDPGGNVAVWDARVGGGFPVGNAASCQGGESCKPPPTTQPAIYGVPASATFSGPGNVSSPPPAVVKPKPKSLTRAQKLAAALKVCKKDKKKTKRTACEKQARKKYSASKAKKSAHTNRRAK
jgi:hypothetical protein